MEINIRTLRDIVNSFRLTQEQRSYLVKSIMAGNNEDITEELTKINNKLDDKQNKNDETLNTNDKTIVGAINEINNNFGELGYNMVEYGITTYDELVEMAQNGKPSFIIMGEQGVSEIISCIITKADDDSVTLLSNVVTTWSTVSDMRVTLPLSFVIDADNVWPELKYVTSKLIISEDVLRDNNFNTEYYVPTTEAVRNYVTEQIATKQDTITPGTGLAFDGDILNVTLDTDVFFIAETIPETPTDNQKKKICLVPAETSEEGNYYTEYVWVVNDDNPDGYWEEFGTYKSEVDLTPYLKKTDAESTYATKTELASHTNNTENPHNVTKSQVGLGNVDNTSDINKPVSTAQQTAINAVNNKTAVITQVPTLAADYTIPINATNREYIYEISVGATVYNITGAEGIKWADGVAPIATANSTIVVSVMNNLAVWGTF